MYVKNTHRISIYESFAEHEIEQELKEALINSRLRILHI
jgi:hypothetical protein